METLANIHPGEVLLEEFLKPINITGRLRIGRGTTELKR